MHLLTESEERLRKDKALAEYLDSVMHNRIVNSPYHRMGNESNREVRSLDFLIEDSKCIENIMRAYCQPIEDSKSLRSRLENTWNTQRYHAEPWREHYSNGFSPPTIPVDDEEEMFILDFCIAVPSRRVKRMIFACSA